MTKPTRNRKPNNGRKRRPTTSMRLSTFERLTHYAFISGLPRTRIAETAINDYLDARGVPAVVQPPAEQRPRYVSDDTSAPALSGIMFLG